MAQPLTDAITALTTYANGVTGASDTTLSDAVRTLADGYGGGGGGGDGVPLITTETIAANTRYVNIDLSPYLTKRLVLLVIDFELTDYDWLYYAINATSPQTTDNYGRQKTKSHRTLAFLYGELGDFDVKVCMLPKDANVFAKNGATPNNILINTYNESVSIKAGSTYKIYAM